MNFIRMVVRPSLLTLLIAGLATASLVFMVAVIVGETRLGDAVALNQWLARDIASQYSAVATRALARAQKFGELVRLESGTFDPAAQKEFESDSSMKAVWVLDATGAGSLQPLARLDRDGFVVAEAQVESVRRLIEAAVKEGSAARGVTKGVNAIALKLGDMPRTLVLFFDENLFSRAHGGPWGDKWFLVAPTTDRTEDVLVEASSELREGVSFPTFDEISRFISAQTPNQERSEFSNEIIASNGSAFQVSGVQTGAFGVMAIAVTPLESPMATLGLMIRIAVGVAVSFALLVMLLQAVRFQRLSSRREAAPVPPPAS